MATADFNGDGLLDIAVANQDSNTVTILLGIGNGGFSPAPGSPLAVGVSPLLIEAGDFNGDGIPDLAVFGLPQPGTIPPSYGPYAGTLAVWLGQGNGAFVEAPAGAVIISAGLGVFFSFTLGDFNGMENWTSP